MLATLEPAKQLPLTSLKEKLIKTGAPVPSRASPGKSVAR
jgi:hypothetical protein